MIVGTRLTQLFIKELIQVLRDARLRGVVFIAPVVQLFLMSYALSTDVTDIRLAVCDQDRTPASRELVSEFEGSRYFRIVRGVSDENAARSLIDREQVQALLAILPRFEEALAAGRSAPVQFIVDGTDSSTALIAIDYASEIARRFSDRVLRERYDAELIGREKANPIDLRVRTWFNDNLDSTYFYVPGMMAVIVGLVTLMLTSMAVVREREIGTLEQLVVTPIRPLELIIGKTLPFACISLAEMLVVLLAVLFWFEVPLRGSLALLLGGTVLYVLSMLGAGLFISSACRTQQQAMMSTIVFFMPSVLLSGFIFPIANMPRVVQWLTYVNPMRYFVEVVRSVFLKGAGVAILWPDLLALLLLGAGMLALATIEFRRTVRVSA